MPADSPYRLTKSRFMAGWQCHKLLWWQMHEPDARELVPDLGAQDLFDQSREVEREARRLFPGGIMIGSQFETGGARLAATREALSRGESVLFEASFAADDVLVRADILLNSDDGLTLVEIKMSSESKEEHIPDTALQTWVLRRAGVDVRKVELMYLNKQFRHPDVGALFVREDVTKQVEALLPLIPSHIADQIAVLDGDLVDVPISMHCMDPRECAFKARCWPGDRFHVTKLYRGKPRGLELMEQGIESMADIPDTQKLTDTQQRQKLSAQRNDLVVLPTLAAALVPFSGVIGYLDFETISRAIPVWPGTRPWQQTVVQFSYHEDRGGAAPYHFGWLAEGPSDPREELAELMLAQTKHADHIVMYSSFERSRIKDLMEALPHRKAELEALSAKLVDLLPVMQNHVYHPDFDGSFSLKYTLKPMVPDMDYDDLMIRDGKTASVEIWRLLFVAHLIAPEKRDSLRRDLLAYCERDTLATVKLLARLRELAKR